MRRREWWQRPSPYLAGERQERQRWRWTERSQAKHHAEDCECPVCNSYRETTHNETMESVMVFSLLENQHHPEDCACSGCSEYDTDVTENEPDSSELDELFDDIADDDDYSDSMGYYDEVEA